jgi:hypothetical protein
MTSQDDLALLKAMYQRGEITDEQYDVLRRHVLWGTPLPKLVDEPVDGSTGAPAARVGPPTGPPRMTAPPRAQRPPPGHGRAPAGTRHGQVGVEPRRQPPRPPPMERPPLAEPARRRPDGAPARAAPARAAPAPAAPAPPRRRRRAPGVALVIASLVVAIGLAGAGVWWLVFRTTGVEPAAYARSVCGSIRDWQRVVDGRTATLTTTVARSTDPRAVRTEVSRYYTDLAERTDELRHSLGTIGDPDLPGGPEYADELARAVEAQGAALRTAAERAGRLDTSNRQLLQVAVASLLTSTTEVVPDVSEALVRPERPMPADLRIAFGGEPSCAPYVG